MCIRTHSSKECTNVHTYVVHNMVVHIHTYVHNVYVVCMYVCSCIFIHTSFLMHVPVRKKMYLFKKKRPDGCTCICQNSSDTQSNKITGFILIIISATYTTYFICQYIYIDHAFTSTWIVLS